MQLGVDDVLEISAQDLFVCPRWLTPGQNGTQPSMKYEFGWARIHLLPRWQPENWPIVQLIECEWVVTSWCERSSRHSSYRWRLIDSFGM